MLASDGLLRPEAASSHDGQAPEFRHILRRALRACDVDIRSAVAANVLLIGEFANIEGKRNRSLRMHLTSSSKYSRKSPSERIWQW